MYNDGMVEWLACLQCFTSYFIILDFPFILYTTFFVWSSLFYFISILLDFNFETILFHSFMLFARTLCCCCCCFFYCYARACVLSHFNTFRVRVFFVRSLVGLFVYSCECVLALVVCCYQW